MISDRSMTIQHNGKTYSGFIGRIDSTRLAYREGCIFYANLDLDYGGSGQGAGGHRLDQRCDGEDVGTAYGCDYLMKILHTVGVDSWEQLKGQHVIALKDHGDEWGLIKGIAHITDCNRVLVYDELLEQWKGESK